MQRHHLVLTIGGRPVYPRNSIIWKMIQALLAEINDGAAHRCHCQDEQQRTGELSLKIPQAAVSAEIRSNAAHPLQTHVALEL